MMRLVETSGCSIWGATRRRQPSRLCHTFLDDLPSKQVGTGLEDHLDGGETGDRFRAHGIEPGRPGQQVLLQRNGDQLLDLSRGQAERLGLHLHGGGREFSEGVDLRRLQPATPPLRSATP